jgi:hypothetical protein
VAMNARRRNLLILLPILVGLLFIGQIGSFELVIWIVLVGLWACAFVVWGKRGRSISKDVLNRT